MTSTTPSQSTPTKKTFTPEEKKNFKNFIKSLDVSKLKLGQAQISTADVEKVSEKHKNIKNKGFWVFRFPKKNEKLGRDVASKK